jgi:hypothetical protein
MRLRDLYYAISEMAVGDVVCRNLDEIKLTIRAEDCPMRLLLPSTEGEMGFIAIGTLTKTPWRIRDLCLWQPIMAGSGIEQCANEMVTYIELYAAAIRKMREPVPGTNLIRASFKLGPVLWATSDFWAIDVLLEIEQYLA